MAFQRERLKALTFLQLWKINNNFIKYRCQSVQLLLLIPQHVVFLLFLRQFAGTEFF